MMKHLKRIDELYKSTYMSAARKLRNNHSKRAEELEIYGKLKGKNKKIDRIFPYKFYLANHWDRNDILSRYLQVNEYLFITNIDNFIYHKGGIDNEFDVIDCNVYFESNYNSKIVLFVRFAIDNIKLSKSLFRIEISTIDTVHGLKDSSFKSSDIGKKARLRNRKDAMNLKKAIFESISDETDKFSKVEIDIIKKFPINIMYNEN